MTSTERDGGRTARVRVWDLPTRLFHWGLATALAGSWITNAQNEMTLHMYCGYAAATLVVWRVLWGLVGSETARFAQFVRGPAAIMRYVQQGYHDRLGHNPLGALSVLALLALVLVQATTGLFSNDDIFFDGPWAGVLTKDMSDAVTGYHVLNKNVLLALIALHIFTVGYYRYRGEDLLSPMLTGDKVVEEPVREPRHRPLWLAALLLIVSAAAVGVAFRFWVL